jgi:hypothetical protein
MLNRSPPSEALKNGKVMTRTHKGTQANFEYSSFKPMLVKRDVIDHFLVIGDVAPLQVPPTYVAVATPYNGATARTASAISATAAISTNCGTAQHNTTQHNRTTPPSFSFRESNSSTTIISSLPYNK